MKKLIFALASGLLLAACGGGGEGGGYSSASSSSPMPTTTPTPTPTPATDYTGFVKEQLTMMSDTADPIDVSTTTFALADDNNEAAFAKDSGNRLYWRANRKRMEAEQIRDSIMYVSDTRSAIAAITSC